MKFSPYFLLDHLVSGTRGIKNTYLIVTINSQTYQKLKQYRKAKDSGY